jgi:putative FmdB family regulatory protein
MPLFTYFCKKCENMFDVLIGVNKDKPQFVCPKCGSQNVEKEPSIFGIKGSSDPSSCSSCSGGDCSGCNH